ncbi:ABC transporter permease [Geodermatophilus sp. DSM 45219]|uniref:ABC transporter permease n=1 Tax=Geodermatophilus sp. DSM 45219 TaxID=1881103 RepID=UPI000889F2E8|nr:ABC transporter permease [Geodermatophilus sp. DSM 45219]SDO19734.1 monosaccharide ABC transporter membrane protein, CUT2 family [Geodermatophilus sp. DSM 45219]
MAVDTPPATPAGQAGAQRPPAASRLRLLGSGDAVITFVLVLFLLVAALSVEGFASARNTGFLLLDVVVIVLIALPLTLVIVTGEIDLSVASTVGLSSAVMGQLWFAGLPLETVIPLCLLLGAVLGAVNGFFVTRLGLPSLAVTIGTLALYRGLAFVVLGDRAVADFPRSWTTWAISTIGGTGIPVVVVPLLVLVLVTAVVLHATPVGRSLYAMGNSEDAARFSGIDVGRTKFWLFVVTGVVSALGGVYWTLRYGSARADNAQGLELQVIAAILLGGVSIFGGRGGLLGVLAGALLLGSVRNALQLENVPADVLNIVTGGLLVVAVVAPQVAGWVRSRTRPRPAGPPNAPPARPAPDTRPSTDPAVQVPADQRGNR